VTAGLPRRLRCCETRVWLCPRGEIALALRWEVAWGDLREGRAQVGNVEGVQWRKFESKLRHDSCLWLQRTLYCLISKKKLGPDLLAWRNIMRHPKSILIPLICPIRRLPVLLPCRCPIWLRHGCSGRRGRRGEKGVQ
jgi:hypothetical protein